MERLFCRNDIENIRSKFVWETGSGDYFEFIITHDCSSYRLWIKFFGYGRMYEVENKIIRQETASKIMDLIFPISKWGIQRRQYLTVDGPHLTIEYHELCEIVLSSNNFNPYAADDLVSFMINEIIKNEY